MRRLTVKPSLLSNIIDLPQKDARQINAKIVQLMHDPMPDGKTKIRLKHKSSRLYRLRCGHYRIIYTYNAQSPGILAIRRRNEGTDDDDPLAIELFGEISTELE